MLTLSQRRSHLKRGAAGMGRIIATAKAEIAERQAEEFAAATTAFDKRNTKINYTPEQYKTAKVVRTVTGWHKVVKVNAKSVTVETLYSWTDRIEVSRIIEVR
jgi:hypothetical protein